MEYIIISSHALLNEYREKTRYIFIIANVFILIYQNISKPQSELTIDHLTLMKITQYNS